MLTTIDLVVTNLLSFISGSLLFLFALHIDVKLSKNKHKKWHTVNLCYNELCFNERPFYNEHVLQSKMIILLDKSTQL